MSFNKSFAAFFSKIFMETRFAVPIYTSDLNNLDGVLMKILRCVNENNKEMIFKDLNDIGFLSVLEDIGIGRGS